MKLTDITHNVSRRYREVITFLSHPFQILVQQVRQVVKNKLEEVELPPNQCQSHPQSSNSQEPQTVEKDVILSSQNGSPVFGLDSPQPTPLSVPPAITPPATVQEWQTQASQKEQGADLELAIAAYQQALTVLTPETAPVEWAETMRGLAKAYAARLQGDRSENLELAIAAYQQALTVLTAETASVEWARTMHGLGEAYADRLLGNDMKNAEQAIEFYDSTLVVLTSTITPTGWTETIRRAADSHDSSKTEISFQRAIRTYENASSIAESVVTGLIDFLSTDNAQVRAEAALVLGKIGDENAVPALCQILATDENPEVRRSAAEALGMIGDTETAG